MAQSSTSINLIGLTTIASLYSLSISCILLLGHCPAPVARIFVSLIVLRAHNLSLSSNPFGSFPIMICPQSYCEATRWVAETKYTQTNKMQLPNQHLIPDIRPTSWLIDALKAWLIMMIRDAWWWMNEWMNEWKVLISTSRNWYLILGET